MNSDPRASRGWALALFLAGMACTAFAALHEKSDAEARARWEFDAVCREIRSRVEERLSDHQRLLRAGAAFLSHGSVTRKEWKDFVGDLSLARNFVGLQGLGFVARVPASRLAGHVRAVRAEGFPGYEVWPRGRRDAYAPVVYIEPFDAFNRGAFGFDVDSEPVRREALARSRDAGEPVLSGKIRLVQEAGPRFQAGALMLTPLYRRGGPHATIAVRREALLGWVVAVYRMDDFLQGVLGRWDMKDRHRVHLRIYDGEAASPEALLYDSRPDPAEPAPKGRMRGELASESAGRRWTMVFDEAGAAGVSPDYREAWLQAAFGTTTSVLLTFLFISLTDTKRAARRRAERLTASLRRSEERWQFALEGAGDGVWDWDIPGGGLFLSKRCKEMLGYAEGDPPPDLEEWRGRVHPDDAKRVLSDVEDCLSGRLEYYSNEHRVRCKDGSYKWILSRGMTAARDRSGRPLRMVGTHSDVTQRKLDEAVLQSRLKLVSFSMDHTLDELLVATLDEAEALTGSTVGFYHLIAADQENLILQAWSTRTTLETCKAEGKGLHYPVSQAGVWVDALRRMRPVVHNDVESLPHRKGFPEGHGRIVRELTVPVIRGGKAVALLGVGNKPQDYAPADVEVVSRLTDFVWDLAERKKAQAELRESENLFRILADTAPVLIWMSGPDKGCHYFNKAWLDFTGRSMDQERGDGWAAGVHPDDLARCLEVYARSFDARRPFSVEYRLRRADGEHRWLSDDGVPRYDSAGAFQGYIGCCIDITERKASEDILRAALSEKAVLLREVHHRVKNNLQLISSVMQLEIGREDNAAARLVLGRIQSRIHTMSLLYDSLGRANNFASVDLAAYIADLSRQIEGASLARPDLIKMRLDLVPLRVGMDQASLCGLIINELVSNSLKHAFPDGRPGGILMRLEADSGEARLSVSDDGVGLPPDFDLARSRSLGMKIVSGLAKQIGGTLKAVPGGGAAFVLSFPIAEAKP